MCYARGATTQISIKSMCLLTAMLSINATAQHQAAAAGERKRLAALGKCFKRDTRAKHAVPDVTAIMRRTLRLMISADIQELSH